MFFYKFNFKLRILSKRDGNRIASSFSIHVVSKHATESTSNIGRITKFGIKGDFYDDSAFFVIIFLIFISL